MFEVVDSKSQNAIIKVIGVGGCGGNAIDHMINKNLTGVEFICANTDMQALKKSRASHILQIGQAMTKGLGAGAKPEIGKQAAIEDKEKIINSIKGADMLFITAGMGGGTGTGAAPVIAKIAKELGILTIAVVTKPFLFEGKRTLIAAEGINELVQNVDSLIVIPNEKLMEVLGENIPFLEAFNAANDVLHNAVSGISEIINSPGLVNVDFADVKTVMSEMGMAMIGSGVAQGEHRAYKASQAAVASPLLEDVNLVNARGVLVNISASSAFTLKEYHEVMETIKQFAAIDATVIIGNVIDEAMGDSIRVTVVATGLAQNVKQRMPRIEPKPMMQNRPPVEEDMPSDDEPDVFSSNENRAQVEIMKMSGMEEYDIPSFLRKKGE
ncbi:MAG: cell division protein FtsZ [Bacteroidota bacterium]|jgi:cell division protein FtsZ